MLNALTELLLPNINGKWVIFKRWKYFQLEMPKVKELLYLYLILFS